MGRAIQRLRKLVTMHAELTDPVKDFVAKYIKSLRQLELILFLRTAEEPLTARELAQSLYSSRETITAALNKFTRAGLVSSDHGEPPRYRYTPKTDELRRSIDETARCFNDQRVDVINLIYSQAKVESDRE